MLKRIKEKGLLAIIMTVALLIALGRFLSMYNLEQTFAMAAITILCAGLWLFPFWPLRLVWGAGVFIGTLHHYFPLDHSLDREWFVAFWQQVKPLLTLVQEEGFGRTPSLLAFTLIFLAACLIAVLGIEYELIGLSYLSLLSYFLLLSIFNRVDAVNESLLLLLCALLANGVRHYRNLGSKSFWFLLLGGGFLGLLLFGTLNLPDAWLRDPLASQSVSLRNRLNEAGLYGFVEKVGIGGNTRTGFGEDDEALGGALIDDATVLFRASQSYPHYWRVDSKDQYTGKGWERQWTVAPFVLEASELTVTHSETENFLLTQQIELEFETNDLYLPLPYGNSDLTITSGFSGFAYYEETQRVNLLLGEKENRKLTMVSKEPHYPASALQQVSVDKKGILMRYLQLPDTLPSRVGQLAEAITREANTLYDQVSAVETYLNSSEDFRYSKVDVVAPELNQDYVDQFLFESKVGYCDNFSSAMVVLLRTLGIPARWAKGFSPGTEIPSFDQQKTYEIKNLNAHSWPEVYFSGFGWVPFEPTPSFINPNRPGENEPDSSTPVVKASTSMTESKETVESTTLETTTNTLNQSPTEDNQEEEVPSKSQNFIWLFLTVLCLAVLFLVYRYGEMVCLLLLTMLFKDPFYYGYPYLLKRLEKKLARGAGETLTHYSQTVVARYPELKDFIELTVFYETYLYGKKYNLPVSHCKKLLQNIACSLPKLKETSLQDTSSMQK
ncbi:transglutaminase family protein [Enterococcus sp. 2201sp1_2201st1_B8_2201SCRN_220225]|uniref:transglutaminase family protein n=3 Tax=unclassified Enterococcus TaxID=2608891 RepID=UPI0034A362F7